MVNASIAKPEEMIHAVLALLQYVINKNSEDQKSLNILPRSAKTFIELYRSDMNQSSKMIVQIPTIAYMRAIADLHIEENNMGSRI